VADCLDGALLRSARDRIDSRCVHAASSQRLKPHLVRSTCSRADEIEGAQQLWAKSSHPERPARLRSRVTCPGRHNYGSSAGPIDYQCRRGWQLPKKGLRAGAGAGRLEGSDFLGRVFRSNAFAAGQVKFHTTPEGM
jgi:hypothetical protein